MTVKDLIEMLNSIPEEDKELPIVYDDIEQGRCKWWEWSYVYDGDNDYAIELRPTLM